MNLSTLTPFELLNFYSFATLKIFDVPKAKTIIPYKFIAKSSYYRE